MRFDLQLLIYHNHDIVIVNEAEARSSHIGISAFHGNKTLSGSSICCEDKC